MAQTPNGTSDQERITHFFKILELCVSECADTRCGPHDVFLWNARRLSEAMLYALAQGTDIAKALRGNGIDLKDLAGKLVAANRLHDKVNHSFEALRSCGNVGVHTQGPGGIADGPTIRQCQGSIVIAVEWFYRDSLLKREMPEPIALALADFKSDKPILSRQDRQAKEKELILKQRDHAEARAEDLERRLSKLTSALSTQPNVTPTVTEVVAMAKSGQSVARKALLLAAGMILGGAIAWAVLQFQDPTAAKPAPRPVVAAAPVCPSAPACPPAAPCPPCEVAVPAAAPVAVEPAALPAAVADAAEAPPPEAAPELAEAEAPAAGAEPAAEVLSCDDGALLIPTGELSFAEGPSPRPKWPQPRPRPPRTVVQAFCIAIGPVTTTAYKAADKSPFCEPLKGNAVVRGGDRLPINEVSWDCARAHCLGRGGDLPTIAQFERAVRSTPAPQLSDKDREFVVDSFPFAVFGDVSLGTGIAAHGYHFGPVGPKPTALRPHFSWNKDSTVAAGHVAVSFRCAWPAKSSKVTR